MIPMLSQSIVVRSLLLATLSGSTYGLSKANAGEVELATATFCAKAYTSPDRQYVYSKILLDLLPKYIAGLETGGADEYIQRNFLSHIKQFESWSPKLAKELCDEAYKSGLKDFPLPERIGKSQGGTAQ